MSNPLDDRLKNEYSTQYVLVIGEDSFYSAAAPIDQEEKTEKISESAVAGLNYEVGGSSPPTKVDPFRQAAGKFWSFKLDEEGNDAVEFYSFHANIGNKNKHIYISNKYKEVAHDPDFGSNTATAAYEDVSDQWGEFFATEVYPGSISLKRKATRLKLRFPSDDLLQNRLTTISLLSDMSVKNKTASSNFDNINLISLKEQEDNLENTIEDKKAALAEAEKNKATLLEALYDEYQNQDLYADPNFQDPDDEALQAFWDLLGIDVTTVNPEIGEITALIEDLKDSLETLNNQLSEIKEQIDVTPETIQVGYAYPKVSSYNYNSLLLKDSLPDPTGLGQTIGQLEDGPGKFSATNAWEGASLNILNSTIKNGLLDSFYNPSSGDYSYDTRLMYRDAPFMMQLPMSPKAMSLVNTPNKNELFVDIKASYNYYSEFYENGTKQDKYINSSKQEVPFSELEMPLIYEVPLDEDGTASAETENTLNTKFKFDKFGHKLLNCGYEDDAQSNKNLNIILDQNSKQFLDNYDNVKTQFPFYVDFKFKSDANKDFATLFNSTGMTNQLVKTWISNFFHSNTIGGAVAVNPEKGDPITIEGGFQGSGYYDPQDPESIYRQVLPGLFTAPICKDEIYKINTTKDFYKIVPPQTSADIDLLGDQLVRETTPDYATREFDLNKWLDGYIKAIFGVSGGSAGNIPYDEWVKEVIGGGTPNSSASFSKTFSSSDSPDLSTSENDLEKLVKAAIFVGKYRQLVDQKSRNYYDIMNKDLAYSETLFYRVQKVAVGDGANIDDGPLVQNFWLIKPNDKENQTNSDMMRYIDTQVKYDQDYEYTVYAYQLVVGTRYSFQFENGSNNTSGESESYLNYVKNVQQSATSEGFLGGGLELLYNSPNSKFNVFFPSANNQSDDRLAIFDVVCEPDVKLIEMPFYKKKVVISDAASTAPEVDIIPLRGQDNEIKINFYPSSVDRELVPVSVASSDYYKYDKIRKNQDRFLLKMTPPDDDGGIFGFNTAMLYDLNPLAHVEPRLLFKNDDFAAQYEIYRMEEAPNSYVEFGGNLLTTINAQELSSFTDKIEQNRKYYYIFRSIDVHGNPSYPSPMYQVEMVENSGAVYPVVSIYEPQLPSPGSKSKPFRRYLKIDAAAMQGILDLKGSELNYTDSAITNHPIMLGEKGTKLFSASDSLSHKKFKFRVKSRHTGKIIDLNVSFKVRKLEPEAIISCGDEVTTQEFADIVKVVTGVGAFP